MKDLFRTPSATLGQRLRFALLVPLVGLIVFALLGIRYMSWAAWPNTGWGWTYLVTTYPSHYWLLALLASIPLLLLGFLVRGIWLVLAASVIYSLGFVLIFIDTLVFDQYRFHINWFVIDFLMNDPDGQVIHFPLLMWFITIGGTVAVLVAVFLAMAYLWRRTLQGPIAIGKWHLLCFALLLASHFLHAWADANLVKDVVRQPRFYPLMQPTTAQTFMERHGLVDLEARKANTLDTSSVDHSDINYPKAPLQCRPEQSPPNILLITIDSWRADAFSQRITPNMHAFAEQNGLIFNRHFSGSNSTRAGIFSMFYGIPGTYWHAFLASGVPSPLITELQNQGYGLGIFTAARLTSPEFDRTVFATVDNLRLGSSGATPAERDLDLTEGWLDWLNDHQKQNADKPFFGFLFYDAPHGYSYPDDYAGPFQPAWKTVNYFSLNNDFDPEPFLNRYWNAVHYNDHLIDRVLKDLEKRDLLENTWVIITGDHGQEFNDLKQNYWGHNSNFSKYQLQVPFVIHAPGQRTGTVDTLTTHYDLSTTLLSQALACSNDTRDYSVGRNLLAPTIEEQSAFMAASYSHYAMVSQEKIVAIDSVGRYTIMDGNYRELSDALPDWARSATRLMYEYFSARQ